MIFKYGMWGKCLWRIKKRLNFGYLVYEMIVVWGFFVFYKVYREVGVG